MVRRSIVWAALGCALLTVLFLGPMGQTAMAAGPGSEEALAQTGITGGLVVQVGHPDAALPLALANRGTFLVQAFHRDAKVIEGMREAFHGANVYGLASAERWKPGRLPYAENLVNLLVIGADAAELSPAEAFRVVCPGGQVLAATGALTTEAAKAAGFQEIRTISSGGTWLIARKPWPAEMDQWPQPRHGADRNVVSNDRLVAPPQRVRWIAGPPQEISNMVSSAGRNFYGGLIARDAFNGLQLWKQRLTPNPARGGYGYKPGTGAMPLAVGSMLIVCHDNKVMALDGATGRKIREYPEAGFPQDMVAEGGLLLCITAKGLRAVEIETGRFRWAYEAIDPRCVAAGDGSVYFLHGGSYISPKCEITCLDLAAGRLRWRRDDLPWLKRMRNLVYHKGALACEISTLNNDKYGNGLEILSAADGDSIRLREYTTGMAHYHQARAIFIGDLLWIQCGKEWVGNDWAEGAVRFNYPSGTGHCFPPVATVRYLMAGEMNMTDVTTGLMQNNPITKGNCSRDGGFMPANGLIYTAPKHCICWPMLRDYTALAPARPGSDSAAQEDAPALERGPTEAPAQAQEDDPADWPAYRHDEWRSGNSPVAVPADLRVRWSRNLGGWPAGTVAEDWRNNGFIRGPVAAPVIAKGVVYIARPDAQQVVAIDADSGQEKWHFTADGRVDTPPTVHKGLCLFGTSSGFVYCLRADNGGMVWRLRASPVDERIVAYGQIESPWPVPGSVLVADGVAYFAAGRHSLADGGIRAFAVEPATGRVIWQQRLSTVPQTNFYDSTGLEFDCFDLLYREGRFVSMSRWHFNRETGAITCQPKSGFAHVAPGGGSGVYVPRGFWSYAPRNESEQSSERPFLRPLLTFKDKSVYGFSEDRRTIFRRDFDQEGEKFKTEWFKGWTTYADARKGGDLWRTQRLARGSKWTTAAFPSADAKVRGGGMVLTANALFVASQQGALAAYSLEDGKLLGQAPLPPVAWDGLAAAQGRLFVSTQDGQVICLEASGGMAK